MIKLLIASIFLFITIRIHAQEVGIITGAARHLTRDNVEEGFKKLQALGIKYLEGATGHRSMSREEYKALLDKYGFDVVAGGTSFEKLQQTDSVAAIIENLKYFGAEYAVCYWIPHENEDFTFEDMKQGIEVFNKAGKQFAEAGISFLYHAHGYEFRPYPGPGTMYDYMMEHLDPRYVNIEMDVFWMRNPGQNPAELLRKYPGRFPITHLKDRMIGTPDNLKGRQDPELNVVLGTGDVNIAEVMKVAKKTGVKYHFIEDESSRAASQLPMHLQYLHSLEYDVQAIEISLEQLHKAMVDADTLQLRNLTAEELTYGHSSGALEDRETYITNIVNGTSDFTKIDFNDVDITVKYGTAWVRGNMNAELMADGKVNPIALKILYVFSKNGGYWKLLSRQAVR
jgi:sugar phosphate isomerase/epimerase